VRVPLLEGRRGRKEFIWLQVVQHHHVCSGLPECVITARPYYYYY
jgi:hypothetical protein